ncbi:MAG: phosphatidate cytidylyltransferase [Bacteroidaceae bacterium]|nr:phosphatidate cytidylyltransferase [Bacteroidaceae bacterium]
MHDNVMKNFIIRTLTAIAIVAVQVLCTYLSPLSLAVLFLLLTALTVNEFLGIVSISGTIRVSRPIVIIGSCYLFFAFWLNSLTGGGAMVVLVPYLLFLLYCYIRELYGKHESPIANLGAIMLSQLYVVLPLSLINVLAFTQFDCFSETAPFYAIPLAMYVFIWINDTGAYLSGVTLGRHKLFPRISPKKSWEGSIGGALLTVACAFVVAHFFTFMNTWQWVGMALVIVLFGTFGDLTESMIKRQVGIKDSGHILPGHGGFLDRLDSMLFAIPATVIYLLALSL